ncbi:Ig-like domain-containing protein [Haemophilus haemoglobinophilus]|nr:Ig-like domain-containing protein [Canicola haemoglobinophilus]
MKIYTLKTTIGGRITEQKFSADKPIQIQAQQDAQYELVDENGNVLQPIKENDTWKWLNAENEEIIVQIEHYQPSEFVSISESPSISSETIQVKSAVLASEIGIGKAVLWGLGGLLGAGGIALAASGGKGGNGSNNQHEADNKPKLPNAHNTATDKSENTEETVTTENTSETAPSETEEVEKPLVVDEPPTSTNVGETASSTETNETTTDNSTEEPTPIDIPTPIIHFDPVTEDNIINLAESKQKAVTISGQVEHANNGSQVSFYIGEVSYTAEVIQGKFSVNVDGNTLATHNNIRASVQTNDNAGNTATGTAKKDYEVDIIAPQPTLVLDDITDDNVINRTEAAGKIQISGVTTEVADGAKVVVACGCPSCLARLGVEALEKTAVVTSGRFSVEFDGSDLVADGRHIITARVLVQDKAGNIGKAEDSKGYSIEISNAEANLVWNNLTDDNVINHKESQNKVVLSGQIVNLKAGETAKVSIKVGDEILEATVDSGHYSVSVDGNKLTPHRSVEAVLTITDKFGNVTTKNVQHQYDVDTVITSPTIQIAPINQGNSLNQQQSLDVVTISGTVALDNDVDLTHTKMTVMIHGESYPATISGNHWQAVVPGHKLAKAQGENTVSVKVVATDDAGNTVENTAVTTYQVDTIAPTAEIKLNPIAGDGILEHGEKSQNHTVSGTVSGEFTVGDEITLNINGHMTKAAIQEGGNFQVEISGEKLATEGEHNVKAELHLIDQAGNESTIHTNKSYQVKDAPQPEVQPEPETSTAPETNVEAERGPEPTIPTPPAESKPITEIHLDKIAPEVMEDSDFIRIGGKVKLEGDFAVGYNKYCLHAVTIKIGEKSYRSSVDPETQKFVFDIPESDLPLLKDKPVSYSFETDNYIYQLGPSSYPQFNYYAKQIDTPKLNANNIILDANTPITDGRFDAEPYNRNFVEIRGSVSGDAKVGDRLILSIGDNRFETEVNANLTFHHNVQKELLADSGKIKAVLQRNGVENANTEVFLSKAPEVSGEFVSKHTIDRTSKGDRPYFINALLVEDKGGYAFPAYHTKYAPLDLNETAVLRYQILNSGSSYNKHFPFGAKDIEGVRKALDIISNYANIRFEEVDPSIKNDIAIRFYMIQMKNTNNAYAMFGGNVYMGKHLSPLSGDYSLNVLLHETLHSLGLEHPDMRLIRMPKAEDNSFVSVMSYRETASAGPQLGIFDVAFLHYRFGVNPKMRSGDDVYRFRPANGNSVERDVYIWDGGGVDTFDASDQTQSVNVNLTPGSWIYVGAKTSNFLMEAPYTYLGANAYFDQPYDVKINGGVGAVRLDHYTKGQAFIGYGTQIEKLIGSDFDDTLTGNNANNTIYGGKGNDTINGGGGNDYLDGGLGADSLSGGVGNDIYVVNESEDTVHENADEGNDSVHSYINYTLKDNVENLYLFGSENLTATGNSLNNIIVGNSSDNLLDGKEGTDTLTGGKGKDTFVFSTEVNANNVDAITDFTVGEDKIGLSKEIFSAIRSTNEIFTHIRYEQTTGKLFYSQDTIGNGGTHFATITNHLSIDEQSFVLI